MQYFVKTENDVNIFVNDINPSGEKTILFLHGWPLTNSLFEYQYNELPKYGYRCIGIDIRGFGRSDKPFGRYTYNEIADDIKKVIDTLKLTNITLAGHSVGGAISIRYMARHNGYGINKLALFAAAAPSFVKTPNFPYGYTREEINQLIEQIRQNRPNFLKDLNKSFFNQYITKSFSNWINTLGLEAAGYSTIQLLESLRDESLFNDLNTIKVPTIIFQGIHDKICPLQLGQTINKMIANSKIVLFENSGHALFYEEKGKFNDELMRFIM